MSDELYKFPDSVRTALGRAGYVELAKERTEFKIKFQRDKDAILIRTNRAGAILGAWKNARDVRYLSIVPDMDAKPRAALLKLLEREERARLNTEIVARYITSEGDYLADRAPDMRIAETAARLAKQGDVEELSAYVSHVIRTHRSKFAQEVRDCTKGDLSDIHWPEVAAELVAAFS